MMTDPPRAVAFDVDPDSLFSLRQAFPEWEIEVIHGATAGSLTKDWNPEAVDLMVGMSLNRDLVVFSYFVGR